MVRWPRNRFLAFVLMTLIAAGCATTENPGAALRNPANERAVATKQVIFHAVAVGRVGPGPEMEVAYWKKDHPGFREVRFWEVYGGPGEYKSDDVVGWAGARDRLMVAAEEVRRAYIEGRIDKIEFPKTRDSVKIGSIVMFQRQPIPH